MTLSKVKDWFNRLPPYEHDLPLVTVDGVAYTPRMVLFEVERGSPVGARLQTLVEAGKLASTLQQELTLAKVRLKELLARYPPDKPIVATIGAPELPGKTYTPRELIDEIERQTPIGRQWMEAELTHMSRLMALARR